MYVIKKLLLLLLWKLRSMRSNEKLPSIKWNKIWKLEIKQSIMVTLDANKLAGLRCHFLSLFIYFWTTLHNKHSLTFQETSVNIFQNMLASKANTTTCWPTCCPVCARLYWKMFSINIISLCLRDIFTDIKHTLGTESMI